MTENNNVVDFSQVVEPTNTNKPAVKRVSKGAQVLTITAIEDTMSRGGTPGFAVTFANVEGATFPHTFWNTPKAVVRIQNLVTGFTGEKPTGKMDTASLSAALVGQSSNCIVDANIKLNESNGKVYRNEYPTLRYSGFANKVTPFKDSDAVVNEPAELGSVTSNTVLGVMDQPDNGGLPF